MKKCSKCKQYKFLYMFHKDKSKKDGREDRCKSCSSIHHREMSYKRLYGITAQQYQDMYESQEGKCSICKNKFDLLCVDHNHQTNKVRSLLCNDCNYNLGRYKEDKSIFQRFIDYIDFYE